jgi:hypothetical protein
MGCVGWVGRDFRDYCSYVLSIDFGCSRIRPTEIRREQPNDRSVEWLHAIINCSHFRVACQPMHIDNRTPSQVSLLV